MSYQYLMALAQFHISKVVCSKLLTRTKAANARDRWFEPVQNWIDAAYLRQVSDSKFIVYRKGLNPDSLDADGDDVALFQLVLHPAIKEGCYDLFAQDFEIAMAGHISYELSLLVGTSDSTLASYRVVDPKGAGFEHLVPTLKFNWYFGSAQGVPEIKHGCINYAVNLPAGSEAAIFVKTLVEDLVTKALCATEVEKDSLPPVLVQKLPSSRAAADGAYYTPGQRDRLSSLGWNVVSRLSDSFLYVSSQDFFDGEGGRHSILIDGYRVHPFLFL